MSPDDTKRDSADDELDRDEWRGFESADEEEDDRDMGPEEEEEPEPPPRRRRRPRRERSVVLFADRAGSIIRAGDEALDEESLPVLNAFRQFLEAERRRARRQMTILIAAFSLVLAGVAGGGGWYVWNTLKRVENGVETGQVQSEQARLETVSNLQAVARVAVTLKKDVLDTRKTSVVLQDKVSEQAAELGKLLDTITSLELDNARLQRTMKKINTTRETDLFGPRLEPRPPEEPPERNPEARAEPPEPSSRSAAPPPPARPVEAAPPPARETPAGPDGVSPGGVPYRLPLPRE